MRKRNDPCKDHLGVEYNSAYAMCKAWDIPYTTYKSRIDDGWSVEKALTTRLKYDDILSKVVGLEKKNGCFIDHLGNPFVSVRSMCLCWHVLPSTFMSRVKAGHDLKYCLTKDNETVIPDKDKKVIWVFNEPYATYEDIDKAYDLCGRTSYYHKDNLEEWLSLSSNTYSIDGKTYYSMSEVAEAYEMTESCLRHRIEESGMSLWEAVHTELLDTNNGKKCKDHLGNEYCSKRVMTATYHIAYGIYMCRMRSGWSLKDALTIPVKRRKRLKKSNKHNNSN